MGDWIKSEPISPNGRDLLITAHQFQDELAALKNDLGNEAKKIALCSKNFCWNGTAPPQLSALANQIWGLLSRCPRTMNELYRDSSVSELKIYQVVTHLVSSGQAQVEAEA
jgi:hypothetical protein